VPRAAIETGHGLTELQGGASAQRVSISAMVVTLGMVGPRLRVGYLLEGEFTLLVEGQPPLVVKAGDSYKVPPGAIHDARAGDTGAKVIAT
jgi:hypothetical protein